MPDKNEEETVLAQKHYQLEAGMTSIFRLTQSVTYQVVPKEEIKLLEVNENTIPLGIMPIEFGPVSASGVHFPSIILEVTPDEYEKIKAGELPLPNGWEIGEQIPRLEAEPDE